MPTVVVLGGGVLTSRTRSCSAGSERGWPRSRRGASTVVTEVSPVVGAALLGLDRLGASGVGQGRPARRPARSPGRRHDRR